MLTDHRHEEILSQLAQTGRVGVTSIAATLAVSDETIRRDLKMLEERGLLRRIHGGAVITPDARIGDEAVVGAGSVVFGRVPAGVTVIGNPARRLNWKEGAST